MYTVKIYPAVVCLLFLLFTACKEDQIGPIDRSDTPPGPVTNATVENLPGRAVITYDLPGDSDLLYVKAVYEIRPGVPREVKASFYRDNLTVDGFATTGEYEVRLYAVDRGENESVPVSVTVQPLTPPILSVFESIEVREDFGGINVVFKNEDEADIVISVLTRDSFGDWVSADAFYTSLSEGNFSVRGYEAEEREFGVYVRDRWENRSDTLAGTWLPWYEIELDKNRFSNYRLPSDRPTLGSWPVENIFEALSATRVCIRSRGQM
jgi:hypothetical protein